MTAKGIAPGLQAGQLQLQKGTITNVLDTGGGYVRGGLIKGAGFVVEGSYTQHVSPKDNYLGKALLWNVDRTIGTSSVDITQGPIGPGAAITLQGTTTYKGSTSNFIFSPLSMASFLTTKNDRGTAVSVTPAWGIIQGQTYIADGANCTLLGNDIGTYAAGPPYGGVAPGQYYGAAYVDNWLYYTKSAGQWWGTTAAGAPQDYIHIGYDSIPAILGKTFISQRVAFYAHDANTQGATLLNGFDSTVDTDTGTLVNQVGLRVDRLTNATTSNLAIKADSPVRIWSDTVTLSAAPEQALVTAGVGGTFTHNYANATSLAFQAGGTWKFNKAANAFGAYTGFSSQPTIINRSTSSVTAVTGDFPSGAWITLQAQIQSNPTITADTLALTSTSIFDFYANPNYNRTNSGTHTITNTYAFSAQPNIGAGVTVSNAYGYHAAPVIAGTVTARYGLAIADFTGGGSVSSNYGVYIGAMSGGSFLNAGIFCTPDAWLLGTVYGGINNSDGLDLASTSAGTRGDVNIVDQLHVLTTNQTFTSDTSYKALRADHTITLNITSPAAGPTYTGINWAPTVKFTQNGYVLGAASSVVEQTLYTNTTSTAISNTGILTSFTANPTLQADSANTTITAYYGYYTKPTLSRLTSGTLTVSSYVGFEVSSPVIVANSTMTAGVGLQVNGPTVNNSAAATMTTWTGVQIATGSVSGSGVFTTQYGLDIGSLSGAATNISIRVQGSSPILFAPKTSFGSSSTAATWNAHVMGGNSAATGLGLDTSTTGPTAPGSNAAGVVSIYKGATNYYLLVTFNDGGTTRYRYMQLNGTTATWTHGTTLPT